ncbi:RagB/SusD family nutrient uptake outer membrane protein [Dysgonomonas sp. Marseille-P4677]|uniref:RagB/SusD family nutrient uptake outer membrane protein n=1 Tax=Dysgonomonas sp. Marseille-P4677 TaxID=2364790 RepID=UPI001911A713|nr:RagB/SusD family nutrient uptake outer membrane protein [Dysgonomonas sp. Marseille-P4677]MBK5720620.1 RagB/SusD family nutrient uptake outer membrane protein [Dysgonomonas sp. Marseille-P4677]
MRTRILKFTTILLIVALASCNDYLDKLPEGDLTVEEVFQDYKKAEKFLANTYMHIPAEINFMCGTGDTWARNPFTAGCDEMEIAYGGAVSHLLNSGALNADNSYNVAPVWNECYMGIRKANIFLANIDNTPLIAAGSSASTDLFTEERRNQWKGEAYFLRALAYFQLIRTYGPVPIIDYVLPTDLDYATIKRSPLENCIQFVIDDCDRAASLSKIRYTDGNLGRATAGAALALKSRMLLYAASPIYNGHDYYKDFKDRDGVNLFPTSNDPSKWSKAATAAMECITALESASPAHKLYESRLPDYVKNYRDILLDRFNDEWIFWRNLDRYDHFDNCATILSLRGFSILNPTQEMVDSYHMANGTVPITGYESDEKTPIINNASGYKESGYTTAEGDNGWTPAGVRSMYANREPRFYASINFAGQKWQGTTCDFWYTGKDGRKGAGSDYCKTGYLIAKVVNPNVNPAAGRGYEQRCWVLFRLAEIYLNYAEAINEAEGPTKAYTYINKIRSRAGIANLPTGLSQTQMREAIRRERKIELAFENHRYFDVRRWGIAETTENRPIHCMNIMAGTHLQDNAFYERVVCEPRVFDKTKHYWFPIPQDEINETERVLVQNPGWTKNE